MKKKIVSLSLITLGICSMAQAMEYKNPDVGFKQHAVPSKEMKVADFGEHYKVETNMGNDRQIASEESDRDPSSIIAKEKMKKEFEAGQMDQAVEAPKPWLYKTKDSK